MGLLSGAMKGLAEAGESYAGRKLDERMEARRAERLAGLKREEREYQEGRETKREAKEEKRYGRREAEDEKKYQRRKGEKEGLLKEGREYEESKEKYTSPEGYMYEGGKPKMYQPSPEQAEAKVAGGGLMGDAFLPGRQEEYEQELEPKHAKAPTTAKKDDPAALKIADTIAQKFNIPWQEAWNISQRSKSDPREVALELFRKRRSDVEVNMVDETTEQTWEFVRGAMRGAGFEEKKRQPPSKGKKIPTRESIRADYRAGAISREEAIKKIKALDEK